MEKMEKLTVIEVALQAGVSRPTVLCWIWAGLLPAKKLSRGAWLVTKDDLARYLATPDNAPKHHNNRGHT